jgi:hypothetical protein
VSAVARPSTIAAPLSVASAALLVFLPGLIFPLLGITAAATLLLIDIRLLPLAIFVTTGMVAITNPIAALVTLIIGLGLMLWTRVPNYRPVVILGLPLALYLLIGGANISHYRGEITAATIRLILIHILGLLVAIYLVARNASGPTSTPKPVSNDRLVFAFIPGLLGLALIVNTTGISLLQPAHRFDTSGLALLLFECLTAAITLYAYSSLARRPRFTYVDWTILTGSLFLLLLSGYRGWFIVSVFAVALVALQFGAYRVTPYSAIALAAVTLTVFVGFQAIRRYSNPAGISSNQAAVKYGTESLPPGFRELHVGFRESIALTQELIERRDTTGTDLGNSVLLADLNTMRPGKQQSGGALIGNLFGRRFQGGLTPGAVGAAYTDLGTWSILLFLILGSLIGVAWRKGRQQPVWMVVFGLVVLCTIHFMFRGIPKPSYFVVPLMFLILASPRPVKWARQITQSSTSPHAHP